MTGHYLFNAANHRMAVAYGKHKGGCLTELRSKAGPSQDELSKATGIHVMVISQIERGTTKMENMSLQIAIAPADTLRIVDRRKLLSEGKQAQ